MSKIRTPKIKKKGLRKPLSVEDIEHLRSTQSSSRGVYVRDKAIFELLYSSGCRIAELVKTDITDVNFSDRSIAVTGKGNKQRTVYFSVKAKLFIQEYLTVRKGEGPALFTGFKLPYGRLNARTIQKRVHDMGPAAHIERRVFPHILRHSFASHALNGGMNINTIQKLLGHDQISTTQIYAEMDNEHVRNDYIKFIH